LVEYVRFARGWDARRQRCCRQAGTGRWIDGEWIYVSWLRYDWLSYWRGRGRLICIVTLMSEKHPYPLAAERLQFTFMDSQFTIVIVTNNLFKH